MADPPRFLDRFLAAPLVRALADSPVVMMIGPRQAGKTTLCQRVATRYEARIVTFDDDATMAAAEADPSGFVAGLEGPVMIDEVQRVPATLRAIKLAVDRNRKPGRFLLTGSADVLTLPRVSESLAGRMEVLTLWPLSQGEIEGRHESFVDRVFAAEPPRIGGTEESKAALLRRALRGGYPELLRRTDPLRRGAWLASYVTSILQRDVRDLANVDRLTMMPRLLGLLAGRAMSILNVADLSRSAGVPHTTLTRYLALFEATFLVRMIPAWIRTRARRALKSPRLALCDTALLGHLSGLTESRVADEPALAGSLLENFVAMELTKQLGWSRAQAGLFHFRTYAGQEVDLVLEAADGRIVGLEVKAGATIGQHDFKGLHAVREIAARRFHRGIVLYTGREALPFGPGFWAIPMSALWQEKESGRQKLRNPV